jgi:insertion element IS1 protein InsB
VVTAKASFQTVFAGWSGATTVAMERTNAQQRHWIAALRRRSISVSKSLAMIKRRIVLFVHLHVDKDAVPEMYRLPIQVGGFLTPT